MGHIGRAVADRVRAFDGRVIGVRRTPGPDTITPAEVPAALPEADVVVLSRPGPANQPGPALAHEPALVNVTFLQKMKPGSLLVNVARGSLVDEPALLDALDRGVPEHAILDVFSTEPLPPDSPLWTHPRVTVTPHSSNGGIGRYRRAAELFGHNLRRYLEDKNSIMAL
jgi:phosphoglycerate dehydrogenase-like enzyme